MSLDLFDESIFQSKQIRHYHIGGFYNCTRLSHEVLPFFRKIGSNEAPVTTSLNPQCDASGKYDLVQEICPYLTFFIANEAELRLVSKLPETSTLEEQAQMLLTWGCKAVVVTRGKHGAVAFFADTALFNHSGTSGSMNCIAQSTPLVNPVVDTTGAGDAFAGAFLVEWCVSKDLRASLRAGCTAGSAAVTLVGGSTTSQESLQIADRNLASAVIS
jgi:sugar/nucleoside kinase (ribokinase family)